MSLKEGSDGRSSRKMTVIWGTRGLSHSLLADDYFSNMNPRAMKRIISALTLTGRYLLFENNSNSCILIAVIDLFLQIFLISTI